MNMKEYERDAIAALEVAIKELKEGTAFVADVSIMDDSRVGRYKSTQTTIGISCSCATSIKIELPAKREEWN